MIKYFLVLVCVVSTTARNARSLTAEFSDDGNGKLYLADDVIPLHYRIHIRVQPTGYDKQVTDDDELDVRVVTEILVNVTKPRRQFDIHQKEHTFGKDPVEVFKYTRENNSFEKLAEKPYIETHADLARERMWIDFEDEDLEAGEYLFKIKSKPTIDGNFHGIVRVQDTNNGQNITQMYTVGETNDARRVFPCFDEPRFHTPFEFIVHAPTGATVLSNAPKLSSKKIGENMTEHKFENSTTMATYLATFYVGDSDSEIKHRTSFGATVSVRYALRLAPGSSWEQRQETKRWKKAARQTLDIALKTFNYIHDILFKYEVTLPLKKIDIVYPNVAHPRRGGLLGLENYGMIQMYVPLIDNFNDSIGQAGRPSSEHTVIIHEVVHQWFGNLVGFSTWEDMMFAEGFASFMGSMLAEKLYHNMNFTIGTLNKVLFAVDSYLMASLHESLDELPSNVSLVPIVEKFANEDAIDNLMAERASFVYNKASVILRMLERYVGEEHFFEILRKFFIKHMYKTVTVPDLIAAFADEQEQTDWDNTFCPNKISLEKFIHNYFYSTGVPVVTISQNNTHFVYSVLPKNQKFSQLAKEEYKTPGFYVLVQHQYRLAIHEGNENSKNNNAGIHEVKILLTPEMPNGSVEKPTSEEYEIQDFYPTREGYYKAVNEDQVDIGMIAFGSKNNVTKPEVAQKRRNKNRTKKQRHY